MNSPKLSAEVGTRESVKGEGFLELIRTVAVPKLTVTSLYPFSLNGNLFGVPLIFGDVARQKLFPYFDQTSDPALLQIHKPLEWKKEEEVVAVLEPDYKVTIAQVLYIFSLGLLKVEKETLCSAFILSTSLVMDIRLFPSQNQLEIWAGIFGSSHRRFTDGYIISKLGPWSPE